MKYLVVTLVCMAIAASFGAKPELVDEMAECHKIKKEFAAKIREINHKAKEARQKLHKIRGEARKKCREKLSEDIDAFKSCLLEEKSKSLSDIEELKSITTQQVDDILAVVDTYSAKIKECQAKGFKFEFKGKGGKHRGKKEGDEREEGKKPRWKKEGDEFKGPRGKRWKNVEPKDE